MHLTIVLIGTPVVRCHQFPPFAVHVLARGSHTPAHGSLPLARGAHVPERSVQPASDFAVFFGFFYCFMIFFLSYLGYYLILGETFVFKFVLVLFFFVILV
jgi:hypothetical protein